MGGKHAKEPSIALKSKRAINTEAKESFRYKDFLGLDSPPVATRVRSARKEFELLQKPEPDRNKSWRSQHSLEPEVQSIDVTKRRRHFSRFTSNSGSGNASPKSISQMSSSGGPSPARTMTKSALKSTSAPYKSFHTLLFRKLDSQGKNEEVVEFTQDTNKEEPCEVRKYGRKQGGQMLPQVSYKLYKKKLQPVTESQLKTPEFGKSTNMMTLLKEAIELDLTVCQQVKRSSAAVKLLQVDKTPKPTDNNLKTESDVPAVKSNIQYVHKQRTPFVFQPNTVRSPLAFPRSRAERTWRWKGRNGEERRSSSK